MTAELTSLLQNKADGEAQVSARKAVISKLTDDEAAIHKAALAREQAALESISASISALQSTTPKKP